MKIRLKEPGFEAFNGQIGQLNFVDGLSVEDAKERDFMRLSAVMKVEREDGTTASPADALKAIADVGAPTPEAARKAELKANEKALSEVRPAPVEKAVGELDGKPQSASGYTEEQLAAIADKEGIKGLRKIAEPMGIKGNSIKELIAEILQGPKVKE